MMTDFWRRFTRNRDGNVAVFMGIAAIPLMIACGVAVDYSRILDARAKLQSAVDAAALSTARQSVGLSTDQMLTIARNTVSATIGSEKYGTINTSMVYTAADTSNGTVKVTSSAVLPMTLMQVIGIKSETISATSTATWGSAKMRVALALDNTGSMAQAGKMDALKTATTKLLSVFKAAAVNDGDVYVSIIPFAKVVNVGKSNVNASWIAWSDWNSKNAVCIWLGQQSCSTPNHSLWDGSVTDRDQNYDIQNTTPGTSNPTQFVAAQGTATDPTPVSMLGLTYDWTALNNKVSAMTPVGGTNQQIGIAWAWQSLTAGAPLNAPAKDPKYTYSDVIIILSDGINTENRWYGNGTTYAPQVDARQKLLCDNIKKAGVTIYAIQVNTDSSPTADALQYCASSPSKFVMLTSADQIIDTFMSIGTQLSQLRLSK